MDLRQIYWLFKAGKPKKRILYLELRRRGYKDLPESIFFLSTGRTGTAWFAELLKRDKNLIVFHEPIPTLAVQNKFYYQILKNNEIPENLKIEIGKEIFLTAREEYLWYSYKTEKKFVETNNAITFFAEAILQSLPNSKFVHLYRHPGDVIRSGILRGWYKTELSLMRHIPAEQYTSQIEKIAYFWNEVNSFVEKLKEKYGKQRFFEFNFNEKNEQKIKQLIKFIGSEIKENTIKRMLKRKINISKNYDFPKYKDWSEQQKEKVRKICGKLAEKYGYQL